MAITILSQPDRITPSGNPLIFNIETSNPNVLYFRVVVNGATEVISVNKVFIVPNSNGNFIDLSRVLINLTNTPMNNNSDVVASVGGTIGYNLFIQGMSSTDTVLESYTSPNFIAFNGGGNLLKGYTYDMSDWYMNAGQIGVKYADFLTSKPLISNAFVFQKEFLYFLADAGSNVQNVKIVIYRKDGSILKTITEPIVINPDSILYRLNVQMNMLSTEYDFDVTEAFKMDVALYTAGDIRISKLRTYFIDKRYDCTVDVVNMLWENYEGGIDTYAFVNPREVKYVNREVMVLNGYSDNVDNVYSPLAKIVGTSARSTYELISLPLSDDEFRYLSEIIGSKQVYVELADGTVWGVILSTNSMRILQRKYNRSLSRMNIEFESLPNLDLVNRGVVIIREDAEPNPFPFANVDGAEFGVQYVSNEVQITGINVTVPISIAGAGGFQYQINGGIWTSTAGVINNGDSVRLRVTSSTASYGIVTGTLTVGLRSEVWTVKSKQLWDIPETVTFTAQTGLSLFTTATSNLVTITGINVPITVGVNLGSYSVNGGQYRTTPTTVVNGDTIRLQHTTSNSSLGVVNQIFSYANKTATFKTTSREYDITPDDFSFSDLSGVPVNSVQTSNTITVNGITDPVSISVNSGSYRINGGSWTSQSGSVSNGQTVQLQQTAPATAGQSSSMTLTISNKSAGWTINTTVPDSIPNPFNFTPDVTSGALSTYFMSNTVTIGGINVGSPITITAGSAFTQYRINGGSWVSTAGTVFNGNTVQIRIQSASTYSTNRLATINIGGVTDNWSVTTLPQPSITLNMCAADENAFAYRINWNLTGGAATQAISISGNITYPADQGGGGFPSLTTQYYSFTINAGQTSGSYLVYTDFPVAAPDAATISVSSSNPANGGTISTSSGTKIFNRSNNYYSCN